MELDIRWIQRLENYQKAFSQLENAILTHKKRKLNELEKQGLIQAFEYTFELAWNLMRDYFIYQGITEIRGSRDAVKTAFKYGLIEDNQIWFEIITARNLSSHTYNQTLAEELIENICKKFYPEFKKLLETFTELKDK